MSGVKGRSGRRPWSIEAKRHHIIDRAWELTGQKLESKDEVRFGIAKDIVLKDMTNKTEVTGNIDTLVIVDKSVNTAPEVKPQGNDDVTPCDTTA